METDKPMDVDLATKVQKDENNSHRSENTTEANRLPVEIKESPNSNNYTSEKSCEFNMEAAMAADDVLRAGGFGARDDIGSFLPSAIDSTDFEASIRDARDFEEHRPEISRPGLGWNERKTN